MMQIVLTYVLYGIAAILGIGSITLIIVIVLSGRKTKETEEQEKAQAAEPTIAQQLLHTEQEQTHASPFKLNQQPTTRREAKSLFAFQKADNEDSGITLDAGVKEEASRENMLDQQ
jgi:hypothetical protein